jgi:hypothetical protein
MTYKGHKKPCRCNDDSNLTKLFYMSENKFPRRSCIYLLTPAEKAVWDAVQAVEKAGADVRLTEAVVLLQQAREKLADYFDEQLK